jgi:hypothetical protein
VKPCYLFDLDGTVADNAHRLHYIQGSPKDWKAFFSEVEGDKPILPVITLAQDLANSGKLIVYVSGRSSECRRATLRWLAAYNLPDGALYMRKEGDHRDDYVIKIELLAQILADGYTPLFVFDDRDAVVKAWREAGLMCAQVQEGNF